MRHQHPRFGFTMIEILVVVAIIGVMVGLLLPAVQSSREAARRSSCMNNLCQIGLSVQLYHQSFRQLPVQLSGSDGVGVQDNDRRLSIFVGLLPFMGQNPLAKEITQAQPAVEDLQAYGYQGMGWYEQDMEDSGDASKEGEEKISDWLAGGPVPYEQTYGPWMFKVPTLRCPSDPGIGLPAMGRTNYAACLGDSIVTANTGPMKSVNGIYELDAVLVAETNVAMRGIFVPRVVTSLSDVVDGLSHTIMLGEICTDLGDQDTRTAMAQSGGPSLRDHPDWARTEEVIDAQRPMFWLPATAVCNRNEGRGYRWADGMPMFTGFNTINPPNSPCVIEATADDDTGFLSASSRHQGGANVCFADGSVQFVTDSIDSGDQAAPTVYIDSPSPPGQKSKYGIWGALGTRNSKELISPSDVL